MIDTTLLKTRASSPVNFTRFYDGCLWYATVDGWEFSIPTADTSDGQTSPTFHAREKGILLMRWIRKAMEKEIEHQQHIERAKAEAEAQE